MFNGKFEVINGTSQFPLDNLLLHSSSTSVPTNPLALSQKYLLMNVLYRLSKQLLIIIWRRNISLSRVDDQVKLFWVGTHLLKVALQCPRSWSNQYRVTGKQDHPAKRFKDGMGFFLKGGRCKHLKVRRHCTIQSSCFPLYLWGRVGTVKRARFKVRIVGFKILALD